jgi:bifunctional enzyme CysN/CysC
VVGHVDHGKSTLVGRMLADAKALPDGKVEALQASCAKRGVPFEWAFVMDALQAERDQNITIDASQIWLRTGARPVVLVDAPGHREFLKNMVTGASGADAALLVVASDEGVREQSRRHAFLLSLLGVKHAVIAVTKMDRVDFSQKVFTDIEREIRAFLGGVGVNVSRVVPVAARDGDNIATRSTRTPWYDGPPVLDELYRFERPRPPTELGLRFFVQDVYRFDERRILAGRIEAGSLQVGDRLRFNPGGRSARVASIEAWESAPKQKASAGESIGITLDEQIFVERGHVASLDKDAPRVSRRVKARLFWMGKKPIEIDRRVKLRLCTLEQEARIVGIERVIDASTLEETRDRKHVQRDDVADVIIETRAPIAFDLSGGAAATNRFVLIDGYDVAGGGVVLEDVGADEQKRGRVTVADRSGRNGHVGAVVVVEGDVFELERALFDLGIHVVVTNATDAPLLSNAGLVALVKAPSTFLRAEPIFVSGSVVAMVDDVLARIRNVARASAPATVPNV